MGPWALVTCTIGSLEIKNMCIYLCVYSSVYTGDTSVLRSRQINTDMILIYICIIILLAGVDGTSCYVCDSVTDSGCGEDNFSAWGKTIQTGCDYCVVSLYQLLISLSG